MRTHPIIQSLPFRSVELKHRMTLNGILTRARKRLIRGGEHDEAFHDAAVSGTSAIRLGDIRPDLLDVLFFIGWIVIWLDQHGGLELALTADNGGFHLGAGYNHALHCDGVELFGGGEGDDIVCSRAEYPGLWAVGVLRE